MSLHDELSSLTAAQPAQPGDRLTSVTGKARRMKRTRNALVLAAAIGVAAPVGVLAATVDRNPQATQFAGDPVAKWGDRSVPEFVGIEAGLLEAWTADANGDPSAVRWLYRDKLVLPGGEDTYLAIFRTPATVFVGRAAADRVDESGVSYEKTDTRNGTVNAWRFVELSPAEAAKGISTAFTTIKDGMVVQNKLFVLADPRARRLSWTTTPLPYAPPSDTRGEVSAKDGVFLSDPVSLAGPLTFTIDDKRHGPSKPLSIGLDKDDRVQLLRPAQPDVPGDFQQASGLAGELDANPDAGGYGGTFYAGDGRDLHHRVFVRCYGGGLLRITDDGSVRTPVPCDNQTHEATETGQVIPAGRPDGDGVATRSDRPQVINFVVGR